MTLDPAAMDRLLEITGGDAEFVDELIDTFIDDASAQLDVLRAAAAAGDVEASVRPAHSLKSNSVNVGATALADLSRTLETAGRAGPVADLAAQVSAIDEEFGGVRAALLARRASG